MSNENLTVLALIMPFVVPWIIYKFMLIPMFKIAAFIDKNIKEIK